MRPEIRLAAADVEARDYDPGAAASRGRRRAALRASAVAVASAALTAALIAGGIGARALVHDEVGDSGRRAIGPPTNVAAEVLGPSEVVISWGPPRAAPGVDAYEIERDERVLEVVEGDVLGFTDTTVEPDNRYAYRVVAIVSGRRSPPSPAVRVRTPPLRGGDVTPPSPPTLLSASPGGPAEVILRWSPSTDDVDLAGYTVYRDGIVIDDLDPTTTSYDDGGAQPGATHVYEIDAFDGAGNRSERSNQISVEVPGIDTEPPTAPQEVTVKSAEQGGAIVEWSPSSDDVGVVRYVISRNGQQIGTRDHPATSFSDTTDLCEGSYIYEVVAVDASGKQSPPASGRISVVC